MSEDFQSLASWIIHQEKRHAVVHRKNARRKQLAIAAIIGIRQRERIQHVQKTRTPAAMLDVRPVAFTHRGEVKAIARPDECGFLLTQCVRFGNGSDHVGGSSAVALLRPAHGFGESEFLKISRHGVRWIKDQGMPALNNITSYVRKARRSRELLIFLQRHSTSLHALGRAEDSRATARNTKHAGTD